jgi:hypothetical protein
MAGDPLCRSLTRRRVLVGVTAIAANALAAACGREPSGPIDTANTSPTPAPSRVVLVSTLLPSPTPTLALPLGPVPTPPGAPTPFSVVSPVPETFATPPGKPTTPLIVFAGASNVYGERVQRSETFPAQTMALLAPAKYDAVNLGVGLSLAGVADTFEALNARAATTIDPLYAASRSKNIVVVYDGVNDLYYGANAAETFARMVTFGQARRHVGWKVVMLTLLPNINMRAGEDYENERQGINANIRTNLASSADALADIGGDPTIGTVVGAKNPDYYANINGLLTGKGYSIVARYVKDAILTL